MTTVEGGELIGTADGEASVTGEGVVSVAGSSFFTVGLGVTGSVEKTKC